MKKYLFLLLTLGFMVSCNNTKAQIKMYKSTSTYSGITTQTNDSITNTETTYFSTRAGDMDKLTSSNIKITYKADTTSGTPTTINAIIQGSDDGVTWYLYSGGVGLGTDGFNSDTLTMITAANTTFTMSSIPGGTKFVNGTLRANCGRKPKYVRVAFVAASGTHNTVISDPLLWTFIK